MKIRLLLSSLALALISAPLTRAQAPAAPAAPAASTEEKTDLDKQMDVVGKAFRALGKQAADPTKNDDSAALVGKMITGAKASLDLTPAKAAELPDDQKAKFIADYKAGIQTLIDKLTALQALFTAGKNDEAVAAVADLKKYENKEHKEFRKPKQ